MNSAPSAVNHSLSIWSLIAQASPLVQLILLLLVAASVVTWAIIFQKTKLIRASMNDNTKFLEDFWNSKSLDEINEKLKNYPSSPVAKVFGSGYKELRKLPPQEERIDVIPEMSNIERALNRAHSLELDHLEKYVDLLASTASAAPFIGLFGTVWGIMSSFQNIGATGSASLAVVAPGISEALIATAIGLAAAIPAAIAYNGLLTRIKRVSLDIESFQGEFLNMVQRSLLGHRKGGRNGNES